MKNMTLSLLAAAALLLAAAPASAQYTYPGSVSNYRTAPPQNRDKVGGVSGKTAQPVKPVAPNMNRTGVAAQRAQAQDGRPTAVPTRSRTPVATPPGQARPVIGIQAPPGN